MGILYNPTADPSRVYYGTDTRAFELLVGSFLATVLAGKKPFTKEASIKHKNALKLISVITFSIFVFSVVFIDEYNAFLYRGGLFLFSLNTALLIVYVCHTKRDFSSYTFMETSALNWYKILWNILLTLSYYGLKYPYL